MNASIVIPTYNGLELLKKNLPKVLAALREGDELVVVDDASTDATVDFLCDEYTLSPLYKNAAYALYDGHFQDKRIVLIVHASNKRFAYSCNTGVALASHDVVILLNSDAIPKKDICTFLLPYFERDDVFAVGCSEISKANPALVSGRSDAQFQRGLYVHGRSEQQVSGTTAWVSGGSGAFSRKHFLRLGGFDTDFRPAYGEDIDLSFRATQKGLAVLFDENAKVIHDHETTNTGVFGKERIEVMSYKNALLFMWKTAPIREKIVHFFWLPYHLIVTGFRSQARFIFGFFWALGTLCKFV